MNAPERPGAAAAAGNGPCDAALAPVTLRAEALRVRLGGRMVVDGVDLAAEPGTWTALVGPNGAGKSSLLAALAGVREAAAGRVRAVPAGGDDPASRAGAGIAPGHRAWARTVAWLGQGGDAEGDIGVRDVVRLGRLPHHGLLGAPGPADEAAVAAALRETGVEALAARRLRALSGGERQRVLLARVLATGAPVLLLDEPATHLDAPHQQSLVRAVRRHAARGGAVLTVLHDLTQALMADEIVVMSAGRVVARGPRDDEGLHRRIETAFDHAFAIGHVGAQGRWVAVPQF